MIRQYRFRLSAPDGRRLVPATAYRLYSFLLEQLDASAAEALHAESWPLNQALCWESLSRCAVWTLTLLDDMLIERLDPTLSALSAVPLNDGLLIAEPLQTETLDGARALMERAAALPDNPLFEMTFHTTTSFKTNGRYALFPSERLIVQSAMQKWSRAFPEYALEDEDAFMMLCGGLSIERYALQSSRYPLKQGSISGFYGTLALRSRLPAPMLEIWKALYCALPYLGLGIKTTLGMGLVTIDRSAVSTPLRAPQPGGCAASTPLRALQPDSAPLGGGSPAVPVPLAAAQSKKT